MYLFNVNVGDLGELLVGTVMEGLVVEVCVRVSRMAG
jgi:hypothetical protein